MGFVENSEQMRFQVCFSDPDSHCWTPLMYGVWSNDVKLVRELCRVGGRSVVNDMDRRGNGTQWCPLALAVVRSTTEMVHALLEMLS